MNTIEEFLPTSFENMAMNGPVVLMQWSIEKDQQIINHITPNIERIFGYKPEEVTSGQTPLFSYVIEEDQEKFINIMNQRILNKSSFWESSYRIYAKNGDIRYTTTYTYMMENPLTHEYSLISYLFDQTEIKKEMSMHIALEHRWATAIDSAKEGVWDWNLQSNDVFLSKHWKSMLGYKEHEIPDELNEWKKRIHPQDVERVFKVLNNHIHQESSIFECEHRLLHADGTYRWILDRGKAIERDEQGFALRMIGTHVDITERKEIEFELQERNKELEQLIEQVKELSNTDSLTLLYNRRKMIEEIKNAQHQLEYEHQIYTLAILDLDYFKNINDQYGHTFGDIALQTFANLLKRQLGDSNVIGRWGGEEFIILFPSKNGEDSKQLLSDLQECCNEELLKYRMDSVRLSFSAGICEVLDLKLSDEIIQYADQALYLAKSLGRQQVIIHKEGLPIM